MPAARKKSSMGDCFFFLVGKDFLENFDWEGGGVGTLSVPLSMPLSNDLIRYS